MKRSLILFIIIMILMGLASHTIFAQDSSQTDRAKEHKEKIKDLDQKQQKIASDLNTVKSRISKVEKNVSEQQAVLDKIRLDEQKAQDEYFVLEKQKKQRISELELVLKVIWPVHMRNAKGRFADIKTWDTADRRFTWLSAIYKAVENKLVAVRESTIKIEQNLAYQKKLEAEATAKLAQVNSSKDQLLKDKLSLRASLRDVTDKKENLEAELKEILEVVQSLDYQLETKSTKIFADHKKALPWPVDGPIATSFSPKANPPRRGIGITVPQNTPVKSVFWGKVVHNNTLRGFGKVVIVYHGDDFYTLYAYLGESMVTTGQEVEKDEPIGKAGYYPPAKSSGVYFELRFQQKPINPVTWLLPKN